MELKFWKSVQKDYLLIKNIHISTLMKMRSGETTLMVQKVSTSIVDQKRNPWVSYQGLNLPYLAEQG